ncbi:hypothetical protein [Pisciglobus halotolerans]|uniref:Uncharacterized protein n=1 Tax=Pisciglobus halotolerans TaxID=745365 RepID=A0A1I3BJ89_9LACT|nr:hypothetical protein [Pisciglobus halotolerans]SFH62220.1 hypothetical protein SAMN04489868_1078 [Pisciglobus halotolerans]
MKNNKIVIDAEKEQIIENMKETINKLSDDESFVMITVKDDGVRAETHSPSSIQPSHLPYIAEAFKQILTEHIKFMFQNDERREN